MINLFCVRLCK